ncbi:hypothetical protein V530_02231, partial [Staphylococcus aureus F45749]
MIDVEKENFNINLGQGKAAKSVYI